MKITKLTIGNKTIANPKILPSKRISAMINKELNKCNYAYNKYQSVFEIRRFDYSHLFRII
jgi:hypothetical protein